MEPTTKKWKKDKVKMDKLRSVSKQCVYMYQ